MLSTWPIKKNLSFGKGLKSFLLNVVVTQDCVITTQCHILTHQRYIAVENILRKGEIACDKQFLFFSLSSPPYMTLIFHFKWALKSRLQFVLIWNSLKFCHLVMG